MLISQAVWLVSLYLTQDAKAEGASGDSVSVFGWHVSISFLVLVGAALATFVASIMADEQETRLRNGTFGALTGSAVGGVAALLAKQNTLLLIGFLGSGIGALCGWLASLGMSLGAATTATGRTMLEYQIGGWKAVRERLDLEEKEPLLKAMREWSQGFTRRINRHKDEIIKFTKNAQTNQFIQLVITAWVVAIVDILGLLFDLAKKPKYRSRVTIIVFGQQAGTIVGKHWISDAGNLQSHKTGQVFDKKSIGYNVLMQEIASPHFTPPEEAKSGQERGDQKYRSFLTFRLNDSAILAIDWNPDLKQDDPFVEATRSLFQEDVCPAIRDLLNHWHGALQSAVSLDPLP